MIATFLSRSRPALAGAVLTVVIVLAGCAFGASSSYGEKSAYPEEMEAPAPTMRSEGLGGAEDVSGAVAPAASADAIAESFDDAPMDEPEPDESSSTDRLRVFSTDLEMSVPNVGEARDGVIEIADRFGGYVESSSEQAVTIRVPAERFTEAGEAVEGVGHVLHKNVTAADVTDQFTDMENRLRIARTSRDRLLELLERSTDPDDQVRILREIRRLAEEIERLEASLRSLQDQVAYSRISVWFVSLIDQEASIRKAIPFAWIAGLEPVYATIGEARKPIPITLNDSFAVLAAGRFIDASSATGARVRVGGLINDPVGNTDFWQTALRYHLGPLYRSAEDFEAGAFRGVLFASKDVQPFSYLVAVTVRGDELIVAEAFFPDEAERDRYLPDIRDALGGMDR